MSKNFDFAQDLVEQGVDIETLAIAIGSFMNADDLAEFIEFLKDEEILAEANKVDM